MADTKVIASELHSRYEPARAVTLIGRTLQKALFAGRADDVLFWALVFVHYRGGDLCDSTEEQLAAFRNYILPDPSDVN